MFNHVLRLKQQKIFIFTSMVNSSDLKRDLEIIFSTNLKWKNQVITCMYVRITNVWNTILSEIFEVATV